MTSLPAPLISVAQLRELVTRAQPPVLIDTSFELTDLDAGECQYREAHIPGAHYLHLERDLSGPKTGRNGRHPLPSRDAFAARVGALGIGPGTAVVAYDRQGASYAVRAWWLLRWLGHDAVAVLDGGLDAWRAAGGPMQSEIPVVREAAPYPAHESLVRTVDADQLARQLGAIRLIDARAPERFRGEVEPLDTQAGHIPGARNRFFKDNLGPDGRFKPAEQLRAELAPLVAGADAGEVVHHCGSGVTACHNLFAMELAGLGRGTLYPGSWSEWSSDPSRPIARG
jgi:thiosulfate/3-mercaptopyruvate sulfurtransferase